MCDSFASLVHAQAELDAWVAYYNCERPHQSLGMATPPAASPPGRHPPAAAGSATAAAARDHRRTRPAPRTVPSCDPGPRSRRGGDRPDRPGQREHVRRRAPDLARQAARRAAGHPPHRPHQPARPPCWRAVQDPPGHSPGQRPGPAACRRRQARPALPGQRVTLRIDAKLIQIITADGVLARTLPSPLAPAARGRLHGARLAGPPPESPPAAMRVTRVISSQGGHMVAGVKIHLGHVHRGKVVTVVIEDSQFRIVHDGTQLAACPRTVIKEVTRRSASGHVNYKV
jgi:hypothetical protein